MKSTQQISLALILAVVFSACSGSDEATPTAPSAPSSPSAPVPPSPPTSGPGTWVVKGKVFQDTNRLVCRGCVVEMVDGARDGTNTLTDSNGSFSVDVPDELAQVTLRAMKEGYRSVGEKVATRGSINSAWVDLLVASVLPPAPLRGAYRMKLEADPIACPGLPPSARAREYDILFKSDPWLPNFSFHAEPVDRAVERFDMYAGVSGNDVGVSVWHWEDESAGIIERLNADTGESFNVFAGTVVPYAVPLTAPLKGTVTWCPTRAAANCVVCESSDHRLTLSR